MSGMVVKDYYNLRKTFAMCLLFVLAIVAVFIVTKRYYLLPVPAVLIFTTMITGTFTKDHMVE